MVEVRAERASKPADWRQALREKGYRLTPQRELILAAVDELGHATPDEVLAHVQQQASTVNASTVYRTLEVLEGLGLVRHAHLSDRAPTYHSTRGHEHFHLVCRDCHKVVSVERRRCRAVCGITGHPSCVLPRPGAPDRLRPVPRLLKEMPATVTSPSA